MSVAFASECHPMRVSRCSVLRRLVTLISSHGALQADCDAARRQAESATEAAKRFLETQDNKNNKDNKQGKVRLHCVLKT